MNLIVKNLGMIKTGTIELNGITVIAGKNNIGKSTLGKILYCISRAFYDADEKIREERAMQVSSIFRK